MKKSDGILWDARTTDSSRGNFERLDVGEGSGGGCPTGKDKVPFKWCAEKARTKNLRAKTHEYHKQFLVIFLLPGDLVVTTSI